MLQVAGSDALLVEDTRLRCTLHCFSQGGTFSSTKIPKALVYLQSPDKAKRILSATHRSSSPSPGPFLSTAAPLR
jgi:hypothetical protein